MRQLQKHLFRATAVILLWLGFWPGDLSTVAIGQAPPTGPWLRSYIDWDQYQASRSAAVPHRFPMSSSSAQPLDDTVEFSDVFFADKAIAWTCQILPSGNMYPSYLAGVKEPRMQTNFSWDSSGKWYWEPCLGGRIPLLRWGNDDIYRPQGFEIAAEGAAIMRLNLDSDVDYVATDFRGGVPLSFAWGNHVTKLAYYHMSSHTGDEFLMQNPRFTRLNWSRDALVLGHSIYLNPRFRVYGEIGWAFYSDLSEEWEFQFGLEYAPVFPTNQRGAPFFAANAHLSEAVDFGGNLTAQAGWAWRSQQNAGLFRMGGQYYNGMSSQNSFYQLFEQQLSFGIWYDF